jgi:hypothetical protein
MSDADAVDPAALAALEQAAAAQDASPPTRPSGAMPSTHEAIDAARGPLPAPVIPSRFIPLVTTLVDGKPETAVDIGPLLAQNARLESKLVYVMGLVMSMADAMRITEAEQEKNMTIIREADRGRPTRPGGGGQ